MEKQYATEQEERRMEWMVMEMKLHMKKKEEDKATKSDCNVLKVKLPKLVITRFNGTNVDSHSTALFISKYGKPSEVANAHIQNIVSLPHINSVNLYKIHEFTKKLLGSVQALKSLVKLKKINGYVRLTLDKLQGIGTDLVKIDNGWQKWKLPKLGEALESWT